MAVMFRHVRTGHLVSRPAPDDEPVRRVPDRIRDIAKLDASPMWVRVTDDTVPIKPGAGADCEGDAPAPFHPDRPSVRAPKAAWVDYASHWRDDRGELESMTKAELIERFGG